MKLLEQASEKISCYNRYCLHYNLVSDAVYNKRQILKSPFSYDFHSYLVAALISFDMGRMMGEGVVKRYDDSANGFGTRLKLKLQSIKPLISPIANQSLCSVDLNELSKTISTAYNLLSAGGKSGLHEQGKEFHVGATKLLHFLNPDLFIIIDRNSAIALRESCGVNYRNATQPGYCADSYMQSLSAVRDGICAFGLERFRKLEPGTPLLRIFDKIAFAHTAFRI